MTQNDQPPLVNGKIDEADSGVSGYTLPTESGGAFSKRIPEDWEVPHALLKNDRWLAWKAVPRRENQSKVSKVPYSPLTGFKCSPTDSTVLASFEVAYNFAIGNAGITGIGFALFKEDQIIGGDLDNCINENGDLSDLALAALYHLDTYFEVSPSGTGLRFFGTGILPKTTVNNELGLEIYSEKRFLTVTGNVIPEKVFSLEPIQDQVQGCCERLGQSSSARSGHPDPVFDISRVKNALMTLNPDCSYRDWITVLMALKSTNHNGAFALFDDWSSHGKKYPGHEQCLEKWQTFTPEGGVGLGSLIFLAKKSGWVNPINDCVLDKAPPRVLGITTASEVTMKPIDWIWDGMLAKGKVHLLSGNGGRGKTTLMLAIAALITRGDKFPNATSCNEPADVLYISGEDSMSDTLVPRFAACGGDCRLFHVSEKPLATSGEYLAIGEHSDELRLIVDQYKPALLTIDPGTAFCGRGTDNNNATDIRVIMARLQELATSTGTAVMVLNHMTKPRGDGRDSAMVARVLGSGAWVHAARLVWGVIEEESGDRFLGLLKSNLGALEHVYPYAIHQETVGDVLAQRATIGTRAEGERLTSYQDFEITQHGAKTTEAEVQIRELLTDGPKSKQEIIDSCVGVGSRTVERVAKELGVKTTRGGVHGKATWELA